MMRSAMTQRLLGPLMAVSLAFCLAVSLAVSGTSAFALSSEGDLPIDPQWSARYYDLIEELRCLVCQNQALSESNAPLARDLREEVKVMLADGQSDTEVKLFLTERYGDFVLYRPPFKKKTWLLWIAPFVMVLFGLTVVALIVRRRPAGDGASSDSASAPAANPATNDNHAQSDTALATNAAVSDKDALRRILDEDSP